MLDCDDSQIAQVWIDVESSGLNPRGDVLLEVGMRATNWWGKELSTFTSLVVEQGWRSKLAANPYVWDMHTKSGLIMALADVEARGYAEDFDPIAVSGRALEWLAGLELPDGDDKLPLSGSSVHFDRGFVQERLLDLDVIFSHRHMDVSGIREAARLINPAVFEKRKTLNPKEKHRVQDCIDDSIALWQFMVENFMWEED